MEIDEKIKDRLNKCQEKIINAPEKYVLVSACPGSGKTYTIVKRITKELKNIKPYQGIIACSFTNESSDELKKRIPKSIDLTQSFIGTVDSFVMNIIKTYINRLVKSNNKESQQIILKETTFPSNEINKQINNITKFYDKNENFRIEGNKYLKIWYNKLKQGNYEVSFPTYIIGKKIVEMKVFNEFFSERYTSMYIDEAQDLNWFQHKFINAIKENTNIDIIMVGDPLQSIYQFRGARPELFNNLELNDYKKYSIDVSVRCHQSIMYYANKIYNEPIDKLTVESKVKFIYNDDFNLNFLKSLSDGVFILTESNPTAIKLYELYKNDFDIIYTKKLDNMPEDYNSNKDVIDELLKYYLNYDNKKDIYKYSAEQLFKLLSVLNKKLRLQQLYVRNRDLNKYLTEILEILKIEVSADTITEIINKLEDEKYKYSYFVVDKDNRIMTIHSSKGLESENVVIVLDNPYNRVDDEFKNKLFVAITRAKNNVYILTSNNNTIENYINELLE